MNVLTTTNPNNPYTLPHPLDMDYNTLMVFRHQLAIMQNKEILNHTAGFISKILFYKENLTNIINNPSKESIRLAIIDILKLRFNAAKAEYIPDTAKNLMLLAQFCSCCIEQEQNATVYAKEALEQAITEGDESITIALSTLKKIYPQDLNKKNAIISLVIDTCIVTQKFAIVVMLLCCSDIFLN